MNSHTILISLYYKLVNTLVPNLTKRNVKYKTLIYQHQGLIPVNANLIMKHLFRRGHSRFRGLLFAMTIGGWLDQFRPPGWILQFGATTTCKIKEVKNGHGSINNCHGSVKNSHGCVKHSHASVKIGHESVKKHQWDQSKIVMDQ